jgi:hypothetical protein
MKKFLLSSLLILFATLSVLACDVTFKVEGKEKEKYKANDELVVKVLVFLPHRNCQFDIKTLKFNQEGIKILSGTDWKEVEPGLWERKLKIKITADKNQAAKLTAQRDCAKGGTTQSITFKTTN